MEGYVFADEQGVEGTSPVSEDKGVHTGEDAEGHASEVAVAAHDELPVTPRVASNSEKDDMPAVLPEFHDSSSEQQTMPLDRMASAELTSWNAVAALDKLPAASEPVVASDVEKPEV